MSISGPITAPGSKPVGDFHRAGGLGESLGKGVIDAVLHQDAVGADAGLAGVAVFRGDGTLDRHLDIGVVEDDDFRMFKLIFIYNGLQLSQLTEQRLKRKAGAPISS
jgi:hypothetical protein